MASVKIAGELVVWRHNADTPGTQEDVAVCINTDGDAGVVEFGASDRRANHYIRVTRNDLERALGILDGLGALD